MLSKLNKNINSSFIWDSSTNPTEVTFTFSCDNKHGTFKNIEYKTMMYLNNILHGWFRAFRHYQYNSAVLLQLWHHSMCERTEIPTETGGQNIDPNENASCFCDTSI